MPPWSIRDHELERVYDVLARAIGISGV